MFRDSLSSPLVSLTVSAGDQGLHLGHLHHLQAGCPHPAEAGRAEAEESHQCTCPAAISPGGEEAREVSTGGAQHPEEPV